MSRNEDEMSNELKELIEMRVSYYNHHSPEAMIKSGDERLQNFVIDDFRELLSKLENELNND